MGVQIVAVCTDKPGMIKKGRRLHGLQATILADPELKVIDQYGVRNLGVNVRPPGVPGLPVPTTILAGADGKICWIDQTDMYSKRSDPERVGAAMKECLA